MHTATLHSPASALKPVETARERCLRLLRTLGFAFRIGRSWRDRLTLAKLLLKHIAVHRCWGRFTGHLHRVDARVNGRTVCAHLRDNGTDALIFDDVFHRGCYRPGKLDYVPQVVVDAGANIGLASLYFSAVCPEARIYAFEPVEHVMTWQNVVSGRMKVFEVALGRAEGTCNILIDPVNSGGHRLELYDANPSLRRLQVNVTRLDTLIDEHKIPAPDLLKIDAEGSECDILEGLGDHISGLRTLFCEVQSPANHAWIINHLRAHGFERIEERISNPGAERPEEAYSIIVAHR